MTSQNLDALELGKYKFEIIWVEFYFFLNYWFKFKKLSLRNISF